MSIEEKAKEIIIRELGVDANQITAEASFMDDLGADSLDTVQLAMAFEQEFGIEIPEEDTEKLRTVGEAIGYLQERVEAKEG